MKHTYKITGMTCVGCKTNVENALGNLKEILKVTADVKNEDIVIECHRTFLLKNYKKPC